MKENISNRFKELRGVLGMSQKELADKIGAKQASLSDIERGRVEINNTITIKLIELFQVSPDWLFTGKGEMFTSKPDNVISQNVVKNSVPRRDIKLLKNNDEYYEEVFTYNEKGDKIISRVRKEDLYLYNDKGEKISIAEFLKDEKFFPPGSIKMTKEEARLRLLVSEYDNQKKNIKDEFSSILGGLLSLSLYSDKVHEIASAIHAKADNHILNILKQVVDNKLSKRQAFEQLDGFNTDLQLIVDDIDRLQVTMQHFSYSAFTLFPELRSLIEGSIIDDGFIKEYDKQDKNQTDN